MSKIGRFLRDFFLYGGITREEYQQVQPDIQRKNGDTQRLSGVMCTLLFLALLSGSFFSDALAEAQIFYALMLAVCAFISVMAFTAARQKPELLMPLWYLLFLAFGSYAVMLNTLIRPELSAVTLCVFLVAGPLLLIDRPCRVLGFQSILSVVYILCAVAMKSPRVAFADSVNIICCVFLGFRHLHPPHPREAAGSTAGQAAAGGAGYRQADGAAEQSGAGGADPYPVGRTAGDGGAGYPGY